MSSKVSLRREWFSNTPKDVLAGIVVALALIPEALAFSIVAGVDPKLGLYGSFTIAVITAIFGGRTGLVSGAAGAIALLVVYLVKDYGVEYLFAATILMGIIQVVFGLCRLGRLIKYVPRAVMVGFVNALAILMFISQLPHLTNAPIAVYILTAMGLGIIYLLPRFTTAIPSPLVAIVILTAISMIGGIEVPRVGDMGELPSNLPFLTWPQVPLNSETLQIIFPYALTMAIVGLLETLLTASLVDELTDSTSDKNQESQAQGLGNIITGLFGGIGGCAMIGQTVVNIKSGGRQRLSSFTTGVALLFFVLVLANWVKQIPMASLVAVMIMISITTFNWASVKNIQRIPRTETAVTITTVVATIVSHNLAIGVVIGFTLSTIFFSREIAKMIYVDQQVSEDGTQCTYSVVGQLFFASVDDFLSSFDFQRDFSIVIIDLTHSHLWDQGAVMAIDKIVLKYRHRGAKVELLGLNEASATLIDNLAVHNQPDALESIANH